MTCRLLRSVHKMGLLPVVVWCLLAAVPCPGEAQGFSWTVDDTADMVDANPGDGVCATAAGTCTLRAAVMEANARPGDDTILVDPGTYVLTITSGSGDGAGDLDITEDLDIVGFGPANTVIDASVVGRAFLVQRTGSFLVELKLEDLAVTGATGGAIMVNQSDSAVLHRVEVRDNSALSGAGIYTSGDVTLDGVVFADNQASGNGGGAFVSSTGMLTVTGGTRFERNSAGGHGGGIYSDGGVAVYDGVFLENHAGGTGGAICSTNLGGLGILGDPQRPLFERNSADTAGGAVYSWSTSLAARLIRWADFVGNLSGGSGGGLEALGLHQVAGCSFRGNIAQGGGGGGARLEDGEVTASEFADNRASGAGAALELGADLTIVNSTFHGNFASGGGAIDVPSGVTATLQASTVTANDGGGVLCEGTLEPSWSILFGNVGGDCLGAGAITSGGYNIDGDGSCGLTAGGDMPGTDPLLAPLGPHGGPTRTRPLLRGSPALDAVPVATGITEDQRGETRPADGDLDGEARQDIGAYELVIRPGDADGSGWYDAVDLAVEIALAADPQYPLSGDPDCTGDGFFERDLDIPCTVDAVF